MDTEDEEDRFNNNNMLRQRRHTLHGMPRASSQRSVHSIASDDTDSGNYYNKNSISHIGGGNILSSYHHHHHHQYNNCTSSSNQINNNNNNGSSPPYSPPSPRSFASRRFHAQRQTNNQFVQVTSHHGNSSGSHSAHSSISTQPLLRYYSSGINSNNGNAISMAWPPMMLEETEIDETNADVPLLPMDILPSPVIPLELDLFSSSSKCI
jgi:hypothetical protein